MIGCVSANAGACDNAEAEIAVVASSINLMFVMMSLGLSNDVELRSDEKSVWRVCLGDQRIIVGRQCGEAQYYFTRESADPMRG